MQKLLMVDGMRTKEAANAVVAAIKTVEGVTKITPSIKDSALLVECAPYVTDSDLFATAVAAGFNAEVKVDYSLQTAIAEAEKRIEGYTPKF